MAVNDKLEAFYEGYYGQSDDLATKRRISARDSVDHLRDLVGEDLGTVVDVGAGNGSVMAEIARRGMARSISALEISASGLEQIGKLDLPNAGSVKRFDGYKMPFEDDEFDVGLCIHVLEHVEHERLFLRELRRIAKRVFIEVPLEGGVRGRVDRRYGHINYYQPPYLLNLLETSGLRVIDSRVFTSSRDYETFCYGKVKGTAKNLVRRSLLKVAGSRLAPSMLAYLMAVVCEKDDEEPRGDAGGADFVMGATWEDAVMWLRQQPDSQDLVRDAYYDDPLEAAARRYWESEEWRAVRTLIGSRAGSALDIGAGRGIASYALARDGFDVTALEPDPSDIVGAGAIRSLARETGLQIRVVQDASESLPFPDASFDLVFARAVLHHVDSLEASTREFARVLKPGGLFLAIREHVISRDEDLEAFFDIHPLHHRYGGEKAFRLPTYVEAIAAGGLRLTNVLTPLRSAVNYAPYSRAGLHREIASRLPRIPGLAPVTRAMLGLPLAGSALLRILERFDHRPGRLYSFVAVRPC